MDQLKKILSAGTLAVITGFVTEWTKLLHRDSLVHPDWSGFIDGDAMLWSVVAVIILYISTHNLKRNELTRLLFGLVALWIVLLGCCVYFSITVPSLPKVATANVYIYIWRWFFIAADVAAVCAGMTFGLWLAAGGGPAKPP